MQKSKKNKNLPKYILLILIITIICGMLIFSLTTTDAVEKIQNMTFPPEAIILLAIMFAILLILLIILIAYTLRRSKK